MAREDTLSELSTAQTRSISAENPTGKPGRGGMATEGTGARAARDLGQGWKVSPSIVVPPRAMVTLAEIAGATSTSGSPSTPGTGAG